MTKASIPDDVAAQLSAADKRAGLPEGTMRSVFQQEAGGKADFLTDPAKYHYPLNAEGKRIAGHTGKVSTAFGPFGILESTGAKPGYGVAPLKSKDLGEQIRFASDYLAARVKGAGSFVAGLAGYGEGDKYAAQVAGRVGKTGAGSAAPAPVQVAVAPAIAAGAPQSAELPAPVQVAAAQAPIVMPVAKSAPPVQMAAVSTSQLPAGLAAASDNNAWVNFLKAMPAGAGAARQVAAADLQYGSRVAAPAMRAPAPSANRAPNFEAFSGFGRRTA